MELITNWEVFNTASLAFCQFQGLLGIIIMAGIAIFKHNLGEKLELSTLKRRRGAKESLGLKTRREFRE